MFVRNPNNRFNKNFYSNRTNCPNRIEIVKISYNESKIIVFADSNIFYMFRNFKKERFHARYNPNQPFWKT